MSLRFYEFKGLIMIKYHTDIRINLDQFIKGLKNFFEVLFINNLHILHELANYEVILHRNEFYEHFLIIEFEN